MKFDRSGLAGIDARVPGHNFGGTAAELLYLPPHSLDLNLNEVDRRKIKPGSSTPSGPVNDYGHAEYTPPVQVRLLETKAPPRQQGQRILQQIGA